MRPVDEPPGADPHAGWCGEGRLEAGPYPMCAQHGRDVMGWKSPVGVPTWIHHEDMITTSRRQGQDREGLSGGSRSANVRGDEQKLHRRPGLRASWHLMAKPVGAADKVNAALVHGNIAFLPGEICRA